MKTEKRNRKFRILLIGVFLPVFWVSAFAAEFSTDTWPPVNVQDTQMLQYETIQGNAVKNNTAFWGVSQPYSEYLFYQQTFTRPTNSKLDLSRYPVYSGAPTLSFYRGSDFEAEENPKLTAGRLRLNQILFGVVLLSAFALILISLYEKTNRPAQQIRMRIFPVFTMRKREYGPRLPLKIKVGTGKHILPLSG